MLEIQEQRTEGIKRQAQDLVDQAYQKGYKAGQELATDRENELIEQGIEFGRNEALEYAMEIVETVVDDHFKNGEMIDIFGCEHALTALRENTAAEVIKKIKDYEEMMQEEDNEIHVWDEVTIHDGRKMIVSGRDRSLYHLLSIADVTYNQLCSSDVKKTGRSFPEIAQVLAKMKEGSE